MKMLEDLKKMIVNLKIQLATPIEVAFFASRKKYGAKDNPVVFAPVQLNRDSILPIYITAPSPEK